MTDGGGDDERSQEVAHPTAQISESQREEDPSGEVADSTSQTRESQREADPSGEVAETTAEMKSIDLSNSLDVVRDIEGTSDEVAIGRDTE